MDSLNEKLQRIANTFSVKNQANWSSAAGELFVHLDDPEFRVRTLAVHELGRVKPRGALEALVERLDQEQLRPYIVQALENLGDPAAIPYLERFLQDQTEAWPEDNHGPMLRVCDQVQSSITKLSQPIPMATHLPPPLPPRPSGGFRYQNLLAYVPLAAVVLEVPWFLLTVFILLFMAGDEPFHSTPALERGLSLFAAIPGDIGLIIIFRWPSGTARRVCLVIGEIICLAIALVAFK